MSDWRNEPATDRQLRYAASLGIKLDKRATKGQASDLIQRGEVIRDKDTTVIEVRLRAEPTKSGLLSRIAGKVFGSSSPPKEHYTPDPIHAKPGTYDPADFLNPKTGKFSFPKYKHDRSFLVKIDDQTDYRNDIWADLEPDEKRDFSVRDLEDYLCPEIEVDDFETFLSKPGNPHLGELKLLGKRVDTITDLVDSQGSDDLCCVEDDEKIIQLMIKGGYLYVHDVISIEDKRRQYDGCTMATLKDAAKPKGVKLAGKKAELVERMVESGLDFDLPSAVVAGPKFYEWLDAVADHYLAEIHKNAKRFHPLYHQDIWDAADGSCINHVEEKLAKVRDGKYWLGMLTA